MGLDDAQQGDRLALDGGSEPAEDGEVLEAAWSGGSAIPWMPNPGIDSTTTLPRKSLSFIGLPSRLTPSISGAGLPTESRCSSSRWTLATAGRCEGRSAEDQRRPLGAAVVVGDEGELGDHPIVEPCGPVFQGLRVLLEDPLEVLRAEPLAHHRDQAGGLQRPEPQHLRPIREDLRQPVAGQAADLAVRVLLRGVAQEVLDGLGGPVELELPARKDLLDPIAPRVVPGQDLLGLVRFRARRHGVTSQIRACSAAFVRG